MPTPPTYNVLIDQEFSEFEAFQEALENWTVDFHQLDRGRPLIRTILANCGEIQLGYTALNRRYQQRNRSPQGLLTFALLAEWTTDVNWGREKLDDRSLLLYPQDSEIVGVTGPGFQVFVITVPESVLIERAEKLGYLEATELLYDKGGHFRIPGTLLRRLRTGLFTESAPFLNSPSATPGVDEYQGRILDNLIVALASQYPAEFLEHPQIQWVALKRALDYVESHASHTPVKISDLSLVTGASERTLERAFRKYCGIGPKSYLLALRLNGVYRDLRTADPNHTTVKDIATRWGFWHMSQLSSDYRKLFSELPSTTLKRAASGR